MLGISNTRALPFGLTPRCNLLCPRGRPCLRRVICGLRHRFGPRLRVPAFRWRRRRLVRLARVALGLWDIAWPRRRRPVWPTDAVRRLRRRRAPGRWARARARARRRRAVGLLRCRFVGADRGRHRIGGSRRHRRRHRLRERRRDDRQVGHAWRRERRRRGEPKAVRDGPGHDHRERAPSGRRRARDGRDAATARARCVGKCACGRRRRQRALDEQNQRE